jgi:hypothetical protein
VTPEGVNSDSNYSDSSAKCNMVRVEERQTAETATDCDDLFEIENDMVRNITIEDRYSVTCAKTEVLTETERKAKEFNELEACMREIRRVTEDPNSTDAERDNAFKQMEYKMDEAARYRRFYLAQQHDLIRCGAIQTRSRKKQTELSTEAPETQPIQVDNDIYSDYDKEYKAAECTKRRVRFEDFIQSNGERKMISEHQKDNREKLPKVQSTSQAERQKERSAKAIAEAERRGATKADQTEKSAKEIEEQQHDLFKNEPKVVTEGGIQMYREDEFSVTTAIRDASDFTLATFLMENKVAL